jgi:hypothetical protein
MMNLADAYAHVGRHADALQLQEETLTLCKAKLGADHPLTVVSMYNIASCQALMVAKSADPGKQTDLAMESLKKAIAAGFKDLGVMKKDTDLNALCGREDFKKLLAELEAAKKKEK